MVAEGWEGKPIWDRVRELAKVKRAVEGTSEYRKALEAGFCPIFQNYPLSREEVQQDILGCHNRWHNPVR